jgi:DNA mismatch repair protein MSH6
VCAESQPIITDDEHDSSRAGIQPDAEHMLNLAPKNHFVSFCQITKLQGSWVPMQKGITSFFQRVATPSGGAADTKSKPAETARPAAAPAPAPKPTVVVHSMPSTNTASPAVVKTAVVTKRKVIEDDDENDAAVPAAVPLAVAMSDVNEFDSEVAAKPTPEAASGKRLKRSPTEDSDDDIPVITAKPVVAPMFSSPSAKTAAIFTGSAKSSPAVSTPPASVKPSPASTTPSARVGPSASFKSTPPSQSPLASAGASKGSAYDDRGKLQNALLADWFVNRRDKHKNAPGDPDYDPRTLYIPPGEFKNMTPAQAQYWQIKAENMDIVLFFKMGKFYELFDEDAEIGARELDLAYMTGKERLHVGFPEGGYSKYAERLVRLGYKVGRVEQVETVNAQKQRVQDKTTARNSVDDKVVKRDMCSVLTKGTLCDADLIGHDDASYLLALCEDMQNIGYGICLVDTASGAFRLGQFRDDAARFVSTSFCCISLESTFGLIFAKCWVSVLVCVHC